MATLEELHREVLAIRAEAANAAEGVVRLGAHLNEITLELEAAEKRAARMRERLDEIEAEWRAIQGAVS
jgi:uncharacterized coiled-coil DUF342 family protein